MRTCTAQIADTILSKVIGLLCDYNGDGDRDRASKNSKRENKSIRNAKVNKGVRDRVFILFLQKAG